ncbi:MAG TPA: hypothetical protein VEF76_08120 [Patescibacteria group bacterium]|nr:hypothetical protein [Patescibacteria group bacterium]
MGLLSPIFKTLDNNAAAKAAYAGEFDKAFALVEKGADINYSRWVDGPGEDGGGIGNIGYAAILRGDVKALEKALDLGLNPDLQSPYRSPLVVFAIMNKQEEAAKLLVNRGADVDSFRLSDFFSPLALTRIYDMPEVGKLIEQKLSPAQLLAARDADIPQAQQQPARQAKKNCLNP